MKKRISLISLVVGIIFLLSFLSTPNTVTNARIESDSLDIHSDTDFITLGFPGSGTKEDPYLIENYDISSSDINNEGLHIKDTTKYFVIKGCSMTTSFYGLLVENVAPGTCQILDSRFYANKHDGIGVKESTGVIISNNVFETSVYATGLVIDNCTDVVFSNNIVQNNPKTGLAIYGVTSMIVSGNVFKNNLERGVTLGCVSDIAIYDNLFDYNRYYGVEFTTNCYTSTVYHNNFINNSRYDPTSQGRDNDGNCMWYNSTLLEGNFWNDYSGSGTYSIAGSVCCDLYPLSEPLVFEEPTETSFNYLLITLLSLPILYCLRRKRE